AVESRDLLSGGADVVGTDGCSGNIALTALEGTALHVMQQLKEMLMNNAKTTIAASVMKKDLMKLNQSLDYPEYGGAALFGLAAPVIKSHGSSNARAIYHTIIQEGDMVENNMLETIDKTMQTLKEDES